MPIFTAAAAAVTTFFAGITLSSVAAFAVRTLVTIGISKLVANRANKTGAGAQDVGARVQLGPATNNKLAVSYGSAFLAPTVTDAKITTDQKTMYYVFSLCEASSGTMSFGKIFWNGKEVALGAGDYGSVNKVVSLTTNATPPQVDTTIDGKAWIYQFNNGSSSGVNTGGTSAITILQDAGIPVADRWTSTDTMSNTCFIIVKVIYNKDVQDAQQMPRLSVLLANTLTKPGEVLLDYMTNTVYGCAIDVANIDTASLTALDVYSDETIEYIPVTGPPNVTQPRYRIDGPVNTGDNCLSNLQQLVDACDSWLQYSELTGQWTIVMNKPYDGDLEDLYNVDSSVLIGGIDINPIDLNQTYNSLEVQYPNANINDQTDYKVVDLTTVGTAWYDPSLLSPNEPDNRLTIQYPQINNYIRAVYLGVRRLLQSREDLTIVCNLDYSGIQIVAGDVVRVTLAEYGWIDKLFRVSQVQETKTSEGFLGARITAFEYNSSVYADNALLDFIPEANTGLSDPNIFSQPGTPTVATNPLSDGNVKSFKVTSTTSATGSVLYMDFNYGTNSNVTTHKLYRTVSQADGTPYTASTSVSVDVNDLPPATYYWSTTARNELAGRTSASSSAFVWGGPGVTSYDPSTGQGGITYQQINSSLGIAQTFAGVNWSVTSLGVTPVDVTTTATRNIPVYIDGVSIPSTNRYPWIYGTSNVAAGTNGNNFYAVNSTSSYNPANAELLLIDDGDDNWWKIVYKDFPAGSVSNSESLIGAFGIVLFSDTDNTLIQIVQGYSTTSETYYAATTEKLTSLTLQEGLPQRVEFTQSWQGGTALIDSTAVFIRNITPGSAVFVISGTLTCRKQYLPY